MSEESAETDEEFMAEVWEKRMFRDERFKER